MLLNGQTLHTALCSFMSPVQRIQDDCEVSTLRFWQQWWSSPLLKTLCFQNMDIF